MQNIYFNYSDYYTNSGTNANPIMVACCLVRIYIDYLNNKQKCVHADIWHIDSHSDPSWKLLQW